MTAPKVCVAICTHDRTDQLRALLEGLAAQSYPYSFPVLIVDNGADPAEEVAEGFQRRLRIVYEPNPEEGLSAVRNRALQLALDHRCDFLAFIDDDEVPEEGWLLELMKRQKETGADLVFGPVLATYPHAPPKWVTEGGFFERWGDTPGSGNALIRLAALPEDAGHWFLPAFGLTGGEDADFFDRLMIHGARSAIAPDAIAHEHTPPERTTVRFIWRRGMRDGAVIARRIALSDRPWGRKVLAGTGQALAKLGYALNHMVCGMFESWREVKAVGDLGSAAAILLYGLGWRFQFYGQRMSARKQGK